MKELRKLFKLVIILLILISICINILYFLYPIKYKEQVLKYANANEVSVSLIYAIIKAESNFDNNARSHKDALGLMQIRDTTGEWLAKRLEIKDYSEQKLHDPDTNIRLGSWYIKSLMVKYNNIDNALAAYNAGGGNVDKWLADSKYSDDGYEMKKIPFLETKKYVDKIKIIIKIYEILY